MSFKGITLTQIEYFLTVSECLSFTEAAKKSFTSQPSLSRQIANMENQLGVKLFYRTKNNIRLTPEGGVLYHSLSGVTKQIDDALRGCRHPDLLEDSVIRIGCYEGLDMGLVLQGLLTSFKAAYPSVRLIIWRHSFKELREKLEKGELDVIFTLSFEADNDKNIMWDEIYRQQACVLISSRHPMAAKDELGLESFADETFLILSREESPAGYDGILEACKNAGFVPRKLVELPNLESILLSVEAGAGVTLVDENLQTARKENYKLCRVENDYNYVVMASRRNNRKQELVIFDNYILEHAPKAE